VRLSQVLQRLRTTSLEWRLPKRVDILIAFTDTANQLMSYFPDQRIRVLDLESPRRNAWMLLLAALRGSFRVDGYIAAWTSFTRASLVLSAQDNFQPLWNLRRKKDVSLALVQNGLRAPHSNVMPVSKQVPDSPTKGVDFYFCFNDLMKPLLRKSVTANFIALGSFRSNAAPLLRPSETRSIAYISTLRTDLPLDHIVLTDSDNNCVRYGDILDSRIAILREVVTFCINNELGLRILGKDLNHASEHAFYLQRLQGVTFEFIPRHPNRYQHQGCDAARLTVSTSSTLGLESLSRGNRTIILNELSLLLDQPFQRFGWPKELPDEGRFWSTSCSPARIQEILRDVNDLSDIQWKLVVDPYREVLPVWDPGNAQFVEALRTFGARQRLTGTT